MVESSCTPVGQCAQERNVLEEKAEKIKTYRIYVADSERFLKSIN